jgi:ubiquinone/menaquinone biosynthesis C-methylase UbiE
VAYDRNLASINRKLLKNSEILQTSIQERLGGDRTTAVLDIGCGVGVALLELAWMFRVENARFVGINKECGEPLASREDLRDTARRIGLAPDDAIERFQLPELFFGDATHMPFDDESFDVIYASSVLRFVPYKAEFLEDVVRVLRPGGVALLRVGGKGWDYPFGPALDSPRLTPFAARWVLKHRDELIPLETYLELVSGGDVTFELINRPNCIVRVTKHRRCAPALGLRYLASLSLPMLQLGYGDDDRGLAKSGVRSVYEVTDVAYRMLLERGRLVNSGGQQQDGNREPVPHATAPATAPPNVGRKREARTRKRLSSYRVGQRINVKGRRRGEIFVAAKIKMVQHPTATDHLEGPVEWVDALNRTLRLFGVTVVAPDAPASGGQDYSIDRLTPGTRARVRGNAGKGALVARAVDVVPPTPIAVEEIQGPIQAIDLADGTLRVAGVSVVVDDETKIDRIDAR